MAEIALSFIKILIKLALIGAVLYSLGYAIDQYLNWEWLTMAFASTKDFSLIVNRWWDTDTTFLLAGYTLLIEMLFWTARGSFLLLKLLGIIGE